MESMRNGETMMPSHVGKLHSEGKFKRKYLRVLNLMQLMFEDHPYVGASLAQPDHHSYRLCKTNAVANAVALRSFVKIHSAPDVDSESYYSLYSDGSSSFVVDSSFDVQVDPNWWVVIVFRMVAEIHHIVGNVLHPLPIDE